MTDFWRIRSVRGSLKKKPHTKKIEALIPKRSRIYLRVAANPHITHRESRETAKERENKLLEGLESFTPLPLNICRSLSLWPGVESLSWWAEVLQSLTSDTARPVALPSRFLEMVWRSRTVLGSAHLIWQWNCRNGGGKGGGNQGKSLSVCGSCLEVSWGE